MNPAATGAAGSVPDNLKSYSLAQLDQLAANEGFKYPSIMAAIAMAESSGNPKAIDNDSNGTHDVGLWQINSVHGYSDADMEIPSKNVAAAKAVFDSQGYGAWATYNSGAYKQYVPSATLDAPSDVKTNASGPGGIAGALDTAATTTGNVVSGAYNAGNALGKLEANIGSRAFWKMVLKILCGVVLIGVGLYLLAKGS
jgi:hypothetical protein